MMNQVRAHSPVIGPIPAPERTVLLVLRNDDERALLRWFLESRAWKVLVADTSRVVRQWSDGQRAPFIVLKLDDDDPDAFELLGALAAKTIDAQMVVCVAATLAEDITAAEAALLGIERLLVGFKFAELVRALEEMRGGLVERQA